MTKTNPITPRGKQPKITKLSDGELKHYLKFYKEYTPASIAQALRRIKWTCGSLDTITVEHYIHKLAKVKLSCQDWFLLRQSSLPAPLL